MEIKAIGLLCLSLLAVVVDDVGAHGYMSIPPARNTINTAIWPKFDKVFQSKNCGNGMGTGMRRVAPVGPCGDPFQSVSPDSEVYKRCSCLQKFTTYTQGAIIDIGLVLTANHGGRHAFRVCDNVMACSSNSSWLLDAVTGKRYWYIPYIGGGEAGDNANWWTQRYNARFKLPQDKACPEGCVLQWIWWASQSCAMPCEPELGDQEDMVMCGLNKWLRVCDLKNPTWEEFRNCADVKIVTISKN